MSNGTITIQYDKKTKKWGVYSISPYSGDLSLISSHPTEKSAFDSANNNPDHYQKMMSTLNQKDSLTLANKTLENEIKTVKAGSASELDSINMAYKLLQVQNSELANQNKILDGKIKSIKLQKDSTDLANQNKPIASISPEAFDPDFLNSMGYPTDPDSTIHFTKLSEFTNFKKAETAFLNQANVVKQDSMKNVLSEQKIAINEQKLKFNEENQAIKEENQELKLKQADDKRLTDSLNFVIKQLDFEIKNNKVSNMAYQDSINQAINKYKLNELEQKKLKDSLDIEIKELKLENEKNNKNNPATSAKSLKSQQDDVKKVVSNIKKGLISFHRGRPNQVESDKKLYEKMKSELIASDPDYWKSIFSNFDADIENADKLARKKD